MTTLKRTLIILIAALLVVGGLFGLAQWGGLSQLAGGRERFRELGGENFQPGQGQFQPGEAGRPRGFDGQPGNLPPEGFEGFEGRGRGGREAGGLFGLTTVFKNLLIMGVIIAVVAGGAALLNWLRRRRAKPAAPAA